MNNIVNRLHDKAKRKFDCHISTLHADINLARRPAMGKTAEMYERFIISDIRQVMVWHRFVTGGKEQ